MKALSISVAPTSINLPPIPCIVGKGPNDQSSYVYVYGEDELVARCYAHMQIATGGEIVERPTQRPPCLRPTGYSKTNFEPVPVTPENTIWALDMLGAYRSVGMTPFRMKFGTKKADAKWDETLPIEFGKHNVGCKLGDEIVDVDLDWPRAHVFAQILLPATKVFGRKGKRMSHFLYKAKIAKHEKFMLPKTMLSRVSKKDEHETVIAELRQGDKLYTLFPPSVQGDGEQLFFETMNEIHEVDGKWLYERVGLVALCTVFDDMWDSGGRHDLLLGLLSLLRRAGVTKQEAAAIQKEILTFNGDTEQKDRARVFADAYGHEDGTPPPIETIGSWQWLEDKRSFDKSKSRALKKWFKVSEAAAPGELSNAYFLLSEPGRGTRICRWKADLDWDGRLVLYSMAKDSFLLENDQSAQARAWLQSPDKVRYLAGTYFDPTSTESIEGGLNLWTGFNVKPLEGDFPTIKRHLLEVMCETEELTDWFIKWLAFLVQHPELPAEVVPVFKGPKRLGKGLIGRMIHRFVGRHGMHLHRSAQLTGSSTRICALRLYLW